MIKVIRDRITEEELREFLGKPYSEMVKFVVDIRKDFMALGGALHADGEALLLDEGSSQSDLWGGNIYPARSKDNCIEYVSLINIRPSAGNSSTQVQDEAIRRRMKQVAEKLLP